LVGPECREENRPFSGLQHQAQFGLNPALFIPLQILRPTVAEGQTLAHPWLGHWAPPLMSTSSLECMCSTGNRLGSKLLCTVTSLSSAVVSKSTATVNQLKSTVVLLYRPLLQFCIYLLTAIHSRVLRRGTYTMDASLVYYLYADLASRSVK